ncbi:MAG: VOC family protein [Dehalococcoidia bacterium]
MPIEFIRIDHIAMGVEDVEAQAAIFEGLYGCHRERSWEEPGERGVALRLGDSDIRWEVVAPTDDASPLRAFLDSPRGPGVHHVGVQVADIDATRQSIEALGIEAISHDGGNTVSIPADGGGEGTEFRFFTGDAHPEAVPATGERSEQPALGIRRVDHICTAYADRDALSAHYSELLGMRQIWRTPPGAAPDFADCVLEIPAGQMFWEVIQPVGDDSFIQGFIDRRGAAVHHLAFEVADFDAAKQACEYYEIPTFDEHDDTTDGTRWRDLFIHPRHTGGLLTQIFWEEAPHTWVRSDKVRPDGFTG